MALTSCYECGGKVSTAAASCPKCGAPRRKAGSSSDFDTLMSGLSGLSEKLEEERKSAKLKEFQHGQNLLKMGNGPACPSCGATKTAKIGFGDRLLNGGFVGTAGKTHKCECCGRTF